MRRSAVQQGARFLAALSTAVPFAFGLIRAFETGTDFRYVWMALAAVLGGAAILVAGKQRNGTRSEVLARSAGVLVLSTLLAGAVGYLVGARAFSGIAIVSLAFGLCNATGFALASLSRHGRALTSGTASGGSK